MAKLFFYYSTMNAGKSSGLLQSNYNYKERGMRTFVMKPGIDTREDRPVVKSRIGLEADCILFGPDESLFVKIKDMIEEEGMVACIFIDEAQFMSSDQVKQLGEVVDILGVPVMCYGLRSDFQGNAFPGSAALFSWSNELHEVRTICWCGKRASMVLRLDENGCVVRDGNQVEVGGNDKYVSVCRKHFREGMIA